MFASLNIDAIFSEPLLTVAAALLVVAPLVFLIALVKFVRAPGAADVPVFGDEPADEFAAAPEPESAASEPAPAPRVAERTAPPPPAPAAPAPEPTASEAMDRTVVMPQGLAEVQGQLEIAFSQIKMLNKRIHTLETELESVSRQSVTRLEPNQLKEAPMNPADFTQKLLKLAEHVIVLEKEVARMKSGAPEAGHAAAGATKPPIMPI